MTDNEIIKAMQCVIGNDVSCFECEYQKVLPFPSCRRMCAKNALDLINRQKAEIEILKKQLDVAKMFYKEEAKKRDLYSHMVSNLKKENAKQKAILEAIDNEMFPLPFETDFDKAIKTVKSETIKEFAERLKKELRLDDDCSYDCENCCFECKEFVPQIDNIIKEMTEGE